MDGPGAGLLGQTFILCFTPGMGAAPPHRPPRSTLVAQLLTTHPRSRR